MHDSLTYVNNYFFVNDFNTLGGYRVLGMLTKREEMV